jgi:hypothetical protein
MMLSAPLSRPEAWPAQVRRPKAATPPGYDAKVTVDYGATTTASTDGRVISQKGKVALTTTWASRRENTWGGKRLTSSMFDEVWVSELVEAVLDVFHQTTQRDRME